jgi:hypothetical protein
MTDKTDLWTKVLSKAIDIIFVKYPTRTSLGVILGGFCDFLVQFFSPTLKSITYFNFAGSPRWGWWLLGILLLHIPTIISSFRRKLVGNDAIDQLLELIERGDFTKTEKRRQYRKLIEKVSNNVALNQETQREIKEVEKQIAANSKKSSS